MDNIEKSLNEIDDIQNVITDSLESLSFISNLVSSLESMDTVSLDTIKVYNLSMEQAWNGLGIPYKNTDTASLEATEVVPYVHKETSEQRSKITKVLTKIIEFIKSLIKKSIDFFKQLFSYREKIIKKAKAIKSKVDTVKDFKEELSEAKLKEYGNIFCYNNKIIPVTEFLGKIELEDYRVLSILGCEQACEIAESTSDLTEKYFKKGIGNFSMRDIEDISQHAIVRSYTTIVEELSKSFSGNVTRSDEILLFNSVTPSNKELVVRTPAPESLENKDFYRKGGNYGLKVSFVDIPNSNNLTYDNNMLPSKEDIKKIAREVINICERDKKIEDGFNKVHKVMDNELNKMKKYIHQYSVKNVRSAGYQVSPATIFNILTSSVSNLFSAFTKLNNTIGYFTIRSIDKSLDICLDVMGSSEIKVN